MATRHWFIIVYVEDTDRKQITLVERSAAEYKSDDSFDRASRKEFEWWVLDAGDDEKDYCNEREEKERQENEAASYARELADKHDLAFVGQSKTDGILD